MFNDKDVIHWYFPAHRPRHVWVGYSLSMTLLQTNWKVGISLILHPSKKVTQHHFDRLYQSVYGFISIMFGIIWKHDYLSFHWYFICHACFAGTCTGRSNWVQCQKIDVAKLDHNINRWYQFVYEIIFIVLGIKPIYFSFNWYIICYDCLSGMCAKRLY